MLLNYLTLATEVSEIESSFHVQFMYSFEPAFRFGNTTNIPVISSDSGKSVISFPWGMQLNSKKKGKHYWIPVEGILKNPGARALIRTRRCVALTNSYYIKNNGEVMLFYKPGEPVLFLGGIWNIIKKTGEPPGYGFAILTKPAPPRLAELTDRVPLIVSRNRLRVFLDTGKPLMDISWLLREPYYPQLNGYRIDPSILKKDTWTRSDLLPSGKKIFSDKEHSDKPVLNTKNYFWR